MNIQIVCPTCAGTGAQSIDDTTCSQCSGEGVIERSFEQVMSHACRLDDEIKARMAEYIAPLQQQLDDIKIALSAAVIQAGETIKTEYGRVEYVRAGERISWDDRALLGFAVAHPEILKMRATKETAPTTRVKFEVKSS